MGEWNDDRFRFESFINWSRVSWGWIQKVVVNDSPREIHSTTMIITVDDIGRVSIWAESLSTWVWRIDVLASRNARRSCPRTYVLVSLIFECLLDDSLNGLHAFARCSCLWSRISSSLRVARSSLGPFDLCHAIKESFPSVFFRSA